MLASGSGTILRSMLDHDLPITVVLADRPCGALGIAEAAGVATELVERATFGADFDRVAYTHEVLDALKRHQVDLIAMAGFGTILSKPIHDAFPDRIVNTHPALLQLAGELDDAGLVVHREQGSADLCSCRCSAHWTNFRSTSG